MFDSKFREEKRQRNKWAKAAGDQATISAAGNVGTRKYIGDVNPEMTENIRFKPVKDGQQRVSSVKPSCCAAREELPKLTGEMELSTGKAEIGYDEKKRDMVFSFIRHENDSQGREVLENKACIRTIHGKDCFRSNDEDFAQGAMEMRCEAARTSKTVMRQFGVMSAREGGKTTMDRVLPFQNVGREQSKVHQLRELEHRSQDDRSEIHSAATGVAAFAARKQQKQMEFRKKFSKAVELAGENRKSDDYQIYIRKKWQAMQERALLTEPFPTEWTEEPEQREQASESLMLEYISPNHNESNTERERS